MLIICFQQFMQKMGEFVSAEMWTDIVETFCLCFDLCNPGSQLIEQVDSFIALHDTKSSDASEGHKETFRKRITENEAALDTILSKCLVQLFVVNTLKEALERIEASLVRAEYKLWMLKHYLLPSKRFLLTVHTLPSTHLKSWTLLWTNSPRSGQACRKVRPMW